MDQQIPGTWMIGAGALVAIATFFTGVDGTLAYVFYGLAAILIALGVLNWRSR